MAPERIVVQRVPTTKKVCPVCGHFFDGLAKQRYCSKVCQRKADYDKHAQERRASRRERYHQAKAEG